jgi:hypothetical protein
MGTYEDNMFPSVCVEAVEKLGKLKIDSCIRNKNYFKYLIFMKLNISRVRKSKANAIFQAIHQGKP